MSDLTPTHIAAARRCIAVHGRRTDIALEGAVWHGLETICSREGKSLEDVCALVAGRMPTGTSLAAALRVFTVSYLNRLVLHLAP
jgi:predicted DNA-binding ribbon-helix-helix protein